MEHTANDTMRVLKRKFNPLMTVLKKIYDKTGRS